MVSSQRLSERDSAPMLYSWDNLSPVIAKMIVSQPLLGQCLSLAPRTLIHATAIVVHVALERGHEINNIATSLVASNIQNLLADSIDDLHPRLYNILSRAGAVIHQLSYYRNLNEALSGPASNMVLNIEKITPEAIEIAQAVVQDPVLLAAYAAISESRSALGNLTSILTFLRGNDLANSIEQTPRGASWKAIMRRVKDDLSLARAPIAPFSPFAGWEVVRDMAQLWAIGTTLKNCVGGLGRHGGAHLKAFMNGQALFVVRHEPTLVLASVDRISDDLWYLGDVSISKETRDIGGIRTQLRTELSTVLAQAGMTIIESEPFAALAHYFWRREYEDDDGIEGLAEMFDDHE